MAESPPNILFLMTDQQRFDALSSHGGWMRTPNLDLLASRGVDLQAHYSQAPVCVPSRCSIFTGRYPHSHRVLENDARLAPHEPHLFKVLKQADYQLCYTGKNHLLDEEEYLANFDRFDPEEDIAAASVERREYVAMEVASLERLSSVGSYASAEYHDFPDEVTGTGRTAERTLEFLRDLPEDKPWCIVGSFSDPHVPHLAPRRFSSMYSEDRIPIPEWDPRELETKPMRVKVKRELQNAHKASEAEKRHYLAVYASMCSFVDEQIGRILTALEKRADAENTIVVFISDHGDFAWDHGLCKKDLLLYDALLHVPAILSWPGRFDSQTVKETLSEHIDIVPTLLDLAGLAVPEGCQGKSLTPLLLGLETTHRDEVHAEICYPWMRSGYSTAEEYLEAWRTARDQGFPNGRSAPYNLPGDYTKCVRTRHWKYIWYGDGFEELYDLKNDPSESRNVAKDASHREHLNAMRDRMREWLLRSADPRSPLTERKQVEEHSNWKAAEAGYA